MSDKTRFDCCGVRACVRCGDVKNMRIQTPAEDDGMVRRTYFRCFSCGMQSPHIDIPPIPWQESGKIMFAPYRDIYNTWAELQELKND